MTKKAMLEALRKQINAVETLLLQKSVSMKQTDNAIKALETIKVDKALEPTAAKKLLKSSLSTEQKFINSLTKELLALKQKEKTI